MRFRIGMFHGYPVRGAATRTDGALRADPGAGRRWGWHDPPVPGPRQELLRRQFELVRALLEYHLDRLDPDDLLWEPAALRWTVHRGPDGTWVPDWADVEPDPIPVPTGAWVTWHVDRWWSVTLDHARGRPPRDRTAVAWPGDAAGVVARLRALCDEWAGYLDGLTEPDLDAPAPFPWTGEHDRTVADMIAWVAVELGENTAELGQLRLLRRAGQPCR